MPNLSVAGLVLCAGAFACCILAVPTGISDCDPNLSNTCSASDDDTIATLSTKRTVKVPEALKKLETEGGNSAVEPARRMGGMRKKSAKSECQATLGPKDDPEFGEKVRPCGEISDVCTDIPLVKANVVYPGWDDIGDVEEQDYIVQFDVGLHREVAKEAIRTRIEGFDTCQGSCDLGDGMKETCYEVVMTGRADWGDLGVSGVGSRAYNCMGTCGKGCSGSADGGKDCLKHDVCSAWKTWKMQTPAEGYCHDPDCGDEGAMAIYNCRKNGKAAICDQNDSEVSGRWSNGGWFTKGFCKTFEGWAKGQGIPDA